MGRDPEVGQIMEILRQRGVRLIAINDGVDSARGELFYPFPQHYERILRERHEVIVPLFNPKASPARPHSLVIYGLSLERSQRPGWFDPNLLKRIFSMTI